VTTPRHAVVTGGHSGIGAACVRLLRDRGWHVTVWDLSVPAGSDSSRAVDAGDPDAVRAGAAEVAELHLLVNAAGIPGPRAPMHEQELRDWDRVLRVCLSGTYYCCWALHAALARGKGVVVNIGSMRATLTGPGAAHYSVAKAGVHTLTRALGREWAPHGIRVVAIAPGYTATAMVEEGIARGDIDGDALAATAPMHRLADPAEIAGVVLALTAEPFCFVTGTVIAVDGGSTA